MSSSTQDATPTLRIDLHPAQEWAFFSPATEILYGGAAGGGKSLLLRVSAIRWCQEVPGVQVYLFRRTYPDLIENHLNGPKSLFVLLADLLKTKRVRYRGKENEFIFWNGSRIKLCHCQHEKDVQTWQGAEFHVLMFDEATHFTEFQYRFLRSRVRCPGLNIPEQYKAFLPRIEAGSNPGSIGHGWVKKAFVTPRTPREIWQTSEEEGGMLRQYLPAKLEDNPSMLEEDPTYEARLNGLGSPSLVRALRHGDWDIFAGQFFGEWRRDIHVLPADTKIEPWWERFGAYDHGFAHPAVFGAFASDNDGTAYLFREWAERYQRVDQIAEGIYHRLGAEEYKRFQLAPIYAGHDVFSKGRDGGPSIAEKFLGLPEELRLNMIPANIDRIQGAQHVRDYLAWENLPKIQLDSGKVVTMKGPRVFVLEQCTRTIDCIPRMIHDEKRPEDVLKVDATDNDPWNGDDPYDMFRYGLMSRPPISRQPKPKEEWGSMAWFKRQAKQQEKKFKRSPYYVKRM